MRLKIAVGATMVLFILLACEWHCMAKYIVYICIVMHCVTKGFSVCNVVVVFVLFLIIIVVIITWPSEKSSEKNNSDITVIWVCDWFKLVDLFKISSLMSQFSTYKRILSVFGCFLFAVFHDC